MKLNTEMLRNEIARREMSLTEFSNKARIPLATLQRALSGGEPRVKTLGQIANALGVEPYQVLKGEFNAASTS